MEDKELTSIIEALLFVSESPLNISTIYKVIEKKIGKAKIQTILRKLIEDYCQDSDGLRITKVAGGYQMTTKPELSNWLRKLYKSEKKERLSTPALETLAIIAYKQPITRAEIEQIRGVNTEGVLKTLLEKGLIRISGRKDTIGRPILYNTSRLFLEYFGLGSLNDLPPLKEGEEKDLDLESKEKEIYEKSEKK